MADSSSMSLIEVQTGNRTSVTGDQNDVSFPAGVTWGDVLDARFAPYPSKSIPELLHYATHVNKKYILMHERA